MFWNATTLSKKDSIFYSILKCFYSVFILCGYVIRHYTDFTVIWPVIFHPFTLTASQRLSVLKHWLNSGRYWSTWSQLNVAFESYSSRMWWSLIQWVLKNVVKTYHSQPSAVFDKGHLFSCFICQIFTKTKYPYQVNRVKLSCALCPKASFYLPSIPLVGS